MFAGALALGLEGIVAKDAKRPYIEGPAENRFWLKIKNKDFKRKEPVEFRQRTGNKRAGYQSRQKPVTPVRRLKGSLRSMQMPVAASR